MYFTDSPEFGGAEQVLLTLMSGLDRQNWRTTLVHHPEVGMAPLVDRATRYGVKIRVLPRRTGRRFGRARQAAALAGLIRAERPDVFHANLAWPLAGKYALLTAAASSVPAVVATVHSFDVPITRRAALVQHAVGFGVDRYVAVCEFIAQHLRSRLNVPSSKLCTVPNGIPTAMFASGVCRPDLRAELVGSSNRAIVLTPARLDPHKGHAVLLSAAAELPDATFAFAGDGPSRASLQDQAVRLGVADRVRFLGYRDDVQDLLATCDLVVLPSLCEGFSLAIVEAMAAGKPIIATNSGGTPEIVRHGDNGLLVPAGEPSNLAAAIRALLADPARARELAEAARVQARREFSAGRMVERVEAVYTDALARSPHRRSA
jgi:glycosyltransferase involved in cell wall biosynthesis